ncbi:MAG: TerC family protein [Leptospirales bacterium]|nr:TerC family protein [Leptospirales bacterium]
MDVLFPLQEYWWFYAVFMIFVFAMLALDLGVFHRQAHAVSIKEATVWSIVWITLALGFNVFFYFYARWEFMSQGMPGAEDEARRVALEFLSGYLIEKSLSIDNIFVFVLVFTYFSIPLAYQHRILFYGILGALVFRAIFIALGSVLMQYHWVLYVFGGFLIFTGLKMAIVKDKPVDLSQNILIRLINRIMPTTHSLDHAHFFTRVNGVLHATPLFVALVFIEFSDIIFAVDSVPAIYALTQEPLIVFISNVFAILGLRSLFFMLAGMVDRFHLLKYGLALVLIFVGLKMVYLNNAFGGKFPITWSLAIIGTLIGSFTILSLLVPQKKEAPKE